MTEDFLGSIPSDSTLEARFSFIDNEMLRVNVVIYFRYIIFLLTLSEEKQIDTLKYSLYKDIIVYTASIVESLLDYTVRRQVLLGHANEDVMGFGKKSVNIGKVKHECNDLYHEVIEVVQTKKYPKLGSKDRIDFKDITSAAKKAHILDEGLFNKAEKLRKKRNTIHLSTLTKSSDDYFDKAAVNEAFGWAHDIIEKIEKLYSK